VLVPHAGVQWSGAVALAAYRAVAGRAFDRVFVVGPSHHQDLGREFWVDTEHVVYHVGGHEVPVVSVAADTNSSKNKKKEVAAVFAEEHCIELQVAFLTRLLLRGWKLVPVLCGPQAGPRLAQWLDQSLTRRDLLVVTADLTHDSRGDMDAATLRALGQYDHRYLSASADTDARGALVALVTLAYNSTRRWVADFKRYERPAHVGYFSAVFLSPPDFATDRDGVGCFVTLRDAKTSAVQGCMGSLEGGDWRACRKRSRALADQDQRFGKRVPGAAVQEQFVLLSPRVRVAPSAFADRFIPDFHGVVLHRTNGTSALFLPDVWREHFRGDTEAFLNALCAKAASSPATGCDAWRRETEYLELFTTTSPL
jgi:AmmeMemoRadiSam system protein B